MRTCISCPISTLSTLLSANLCSRKTKYEVKNLYTQIKVTEEGLSISRILYSLTNYFKNIFI